MLFFGGTFGLLFVALWIFCVIDVLTTPETQVRTLPKLAWIFIVVLLFDIGSIAWLLAGRNWNRVPAQLQRKREAGGDPWAVPTSTSRRTVAMNPDDDEEFLASLKARADEQRRRAREAQPPDDEQPSAG